MSHKQSVIIYTDGACRGNPGPGGWGVILRCEKGEKELFGADPDTTNNKMELTATIHALRALKVPCSVELWTDSQYVMKGITEWIKGWTKNNWKTASKKPVKNAELWKELLEETKRHHIDWKWVKGHSGHPDNERVDDLANIAIDEMLEAS
jgi:ribonuclease HI